MDMEIQVNATVKYIAILPTGRVVHASKRRKTGTVPWKIKRMYILY